MESAELVLDCRNIHGEGIFWNVTDGRMWWTDIHGMALWWLEVASGKSGKINMADRVCCFALREGGGFVLALADGIAFFDLADGTTTLISEFEPENPDTRLNDGRTDRQGRFIVGGMNEGSGTPNSSVVRVDRDGSISTLIEKVSCANSTCFSPDGTTMYFADTPEKTIRAYPYDPETGALGTPRIHADFKDEPGLPDGSCVDAEGGLWNAEWQGRRVVRVAPNGKIERVIEVPTWKPTCCAFGGPDLDVLYITTSRLASSATDLDSEPTSGGLFAVKPGVRGLEDAPFAG